MKHTLHALIIGAVFALANCSVDQQKQTIGVASQAVEDLVAAEKISPDNADKIKLALEVASAIDLSPQAAADRIAEARNLVAAGQTLGAITPDQALLIRAGLNIAQIALNKRSASLPSFASQEPRVAVLAPKERNLAPPPQLTAILTRRETAAHRHSWAAA